MTHNTSGPTGSPANIARQLPKWLYHIANTIIAAKFECWLVGGALRDLIIGREVSEYDLATTARPPKVLTLFRGSIPTGVAFGTVTVRHLGHLVEVTTLRSETHYRDHRHPDQVKFGTSIEADLGRRDFTVNALAFNLRTHTLCDPFNAITDIQQGVIRAIGTPTQRLNEDPLRILRGIRFATTHNWRIVPETWAAIQHHAPLLNLIAPERIKIELEKIIQSSRIIAGFVLLRRAGIIKQLLPELLGAVGYPQRKDDARTLYAHLVISAARVASSRLDLRWAALLHDVAKPLCRTQDSHGNIHYYQHEKKSADMAVEIFGRLRMAKSFTHRVERIIRHHMEFIQRYWTDAAVRRMIARVGIDLVPDIIELQRAETNNTQYQRYAQSRIHRVTSVPQTFTVKDLAINGHDIIALGVPPGRAIGVILSQLHEAVLDDPRQNTPPTLRAIAAALHKKYTGNQNSSR